jgi:CRISPR system Cascade subunit CasA
LDFNLVDDNWIPLVEGPPLVSIREALTKADAFAGLAVENPLETVAVLRQVLLPMYLDACGAPRTAAEWADRFGTGKLDAGRIEDYLKRHRERFGLFGATPFAQVAGLRTAKDETKPVSLLVASAATGNNVPLFAARTDADPPALRPDQAARAVLAAQCWDTAAIKSGAVGDPQAEKAGKTMGNPTGPLGALGVVVPFGRNLAETILLNTPILPQGLRSEDRPQWRAEPAGPTWRMRGAIGLLDLLTWQSRRIRLIPELDGSGGVVVRRVVLAAGDRLAQVPVDIEPHTAWQRVEKPKAGQAPQRPVRHVPGRAAWRGLAPLLATQSETDQKMTSSRLLIQLDDLRVEGRVPDDLAVQVLTVGVVYGNQSAVVEDVISDQIPLPVAALSPSSEVRRLLDDVVYQADRLREAANRLGDDLRQAAGGDKLPWDKGQRLGDVLVHQFTPVVRRMLAGLQKDPARADEADTAWRHTAARLAFDLAEPVLASMPPQTFLGRIDQRGHAQRASLAEARFKRSVRDILALETPPPFGEEA